MTRSTAPVDVLADLLDETPGALQLHDGTTTVWVPRSLVEDNDNGTYTMPEWLAHDRGLL